MASSATGDSPMGSPGQPGAKPFQGGLGIQVMRRDQVIARGHQGGGHLRGLVEPLGCPLPGREQRGEDFTLPGRWAQHGELADDVGGFIGGVHEADQQRGASQQVAKAVTAAGIG